MYAREGEDIMKGTFKKLFKPVVMIAAVLLIVLCAGIFAACNDTADYTPPNKIDNNQGGENNPDPENHNSKGAARLLTFAFTKEQSSIFHAINIEDFEISDVLAYVTYQYTQNSVTYYSKGEAIILTEEMVDNACIPLLSQPGAHLIKANYDLDGKTVSGSFMLYLKAKSVDNRVKLTFNLDGGHAAFGTTTGSGDAAAAEEKIVSGSEFTWQEFISAFPVYKEKKAISAWKYSGGTFSADSPSLKITSGMTFTPVWKDDVISVSFALNKPADATPVDPENPPVQPERQTVLRRDGFVARPDALNINSFYGYQFLGWFTEDGKLWNFNSKVGDSSFTLAAHWAICTYDVTFKLMGGELVYPEEMPYTAAKKVEGEIKTERANDMDYAITFYEIPYNTRFSDCYSELEINGALKKVYLAHVASIMKKGGIYFDVENWYTDNTCSDLFEIDDQTAVTRSLTLYANWIQSDDIDDINDYYVNYLYKDGLTIKGDGTLRIDRLFDMSVNNIEVPDSIQINGTSYYITEIAEKAFQNAQSLVKLDLSGAKHLESIGEYAFANSVELREVVFPNANENAIHNVGANAFDGTYWRNNYYEETNEKFIVINSILYEYIYKGSQKDLSVADFPSGVNVIAAGCFANNDVLETVVLPESVKTIYGYAFSGVANLKSVTASGMLDFIDGNAFADTDYFSGVNNANVINDAIIIGNVYFRYVGAKTNKSAVIPDGVTIIASNAFADKVGIELITFENGCDQNIISIGVNAFNSTQWAKSKRTYANADTYVTEDGFVVINGILAAYIGKSETVKLPSDIEIISSGAFGASNNKTKRILIEKIPKIESTAFSGLNAVESITFKSISEILPEIEADSFCDKNGATPEGLKIYFAGDAWKERFALASSGGLDDYPVWDKLYETEPQLIEQYTVSSVAVNKQILPGYYLNNSAEDFDVFNYLVEHCGLKVDVSGSTIINGLIVTTSDGYFEYEDWTNAPTDKNKISGKTGNQSFSVDYNKDTSLKVVYSYTVISAIKDAPQYDKNNIDTVINANSNTCGVQISGLKTSYFTSETKLKLDSAVITYKTYDDTVQTLAITPDMIVNKYTSAVGSNKVLTIEINYYDLAVYRLNWTYNVTEPEDISVEQYSSLSLPLNSVSASKLSSAKVIVKKEDGSTFIRGLNDSVITILTVDGVKTDVLPTDSLGYHSVEFTYESKLKMLHGEFIYSVVLEANSSYFNYKFFEEKDGDQTIYTAAITGLNTYPETMVLPSKIERMVDGEAIVYTVTSISANAFINNTKVKYVYIANTIKTIGENAFYGCTSLVGVYSFVQVDKIVSEIDIDDLEVVSETVSVKAKLSVSGLQNVEKRNELVIPYSVSITAVDGIRTTIYDCALTLDGELFENYVGYIYLPDTDYFREYVQTYMASRGKIGFYEEGKKTATDSSYFIYGNYDAPEIISSVTEQKRVIKADANISGYVGDVVIIPGGGTYTDAENNNLVSYTIIGFEDGAFNLLTDCKTLFLPDTIFKAGKDMSKYTFTTVVYDVNSENMIAPALKFSPYIETIGAHAFEKCTSLSDVDFTIALSLKEIQMYAFTKTALTQVDLKNTSLTEIDAYVFAECLSLVSVRVSENIISIGAMAFYDCRELASFTGYSKSKLDEIASQAFGNCQKIEEFDLDNPVFVAPDAFFKGYQE